MGNAMNHAAEASGRNAIVTSELPMGPETTLLRRARGDSDAFACLYRRHYDAIFRYCMHRLFDRSAAEDATSAVFLIVLERFDRFRGEGEGEFRNWLYRIATNLLNAQCRRGRLWQRFLLSSPPPPEAQQPTPGRNDSHDERLAALGRAIRKLRLREQTLITLRFFEDLDAVHIAEILGGSPATIRSQLSRALIKLRGRMQATQDGREVWCDV